VRTGGDPVGVFRVTFTNTPEVQRLEARREEAGGSGANGTARTPS
jgi:hypothetical protein